MAFICLVFLPTQVALAVGYPTGSTTSDKGMPSAPRIAAPQVKARDAKTNANTATPAGSDLQVSVLTPSEPNNLQYKVAAEGFKRRLMLTFDSKEKADTSAKSALTIEVEPLEDSRGESTPATLSRLPLQPGAATGQITIPAPVISPVELELAAKIPLLDDYQGYLRFHFDGHPVQVKAFRVTRSEADLPLQVYSYKTRSDFCDQHVVFTAESKVPGAIVGVAPTLVSLSLLTTGATGTSALPASEGASSVRRNANFDAVAFTQPKAKLVDGTLSIDKKGPFEFEMVVSGLSHAGLYAGEIAFTSNAYKRVTQSFLLPVRWSWGWALGLALLGAAIAALIQYLSVDQRPRLAVRQLAAQLLWQCNAMQRQYAFDPTEQGVLQAIEARIVAVQTDAQQRGVPDAGWMQSSQTKLQAEGAKIDGFTSWVSARRQYAGAQILDSTTSQTLAQSLSTAQNALQAAAPLDATATALLNGLETSIVFAQRGAFETPLNDLLSKIQVQQATVDPASAAFAGFNAALQSEQQARAALKLDHFDEFTAAFDIAGTRFAQAQGAALRDRLPANAGSTELATWAPVLQALTRLEAATGAAQAQAIYQGAYDHFIKAQVVQVTADVQTGSPMAQAASTAQLPEASAQLEKARNTLNSVGGPGGKDPMVALGEAMNLRNLVLEHVAALGARPAVSAAHSLPSGIVVPTLARASRVLRFPSMQSGVRDDLNGLRIRSKLTNGLITACALSVAGAVAVAYLWLPNPVWGQPADLYSALLWGLGVHSLSTATFAGVLTQFGK